MVIDLLTPIRRKLHRHSSTGKSKARSVTIPGDIMKEWTKRIDGEITEVDIYIVNGGMYIKPVGIKEEMAS